MRRVVLCHWGFLLGALVCLGAEPARLRFEGFDAAGRPRLGQANASNIVARLEVSADLVHWTELARLHGPFAGFPDLTAAGADARFYRTRLSARTGADDWKNHAVFPGDPLLSPEPGWDRFEPRWLKFTLVLAEPGRVYFQDSTRYPFHYDFAVARLAPFQGLSRAAFDAITLRRTNQQAVLGAVLFAPGELREIGLQFVGLDPYPPEQVAAWFEQVTAVIEAPPGMRLFYFPIYEQQAVAEANREFFAQRGIALGSSARWLADDECYSPGWALGRLAWVPPGELSAAYADGRLRPDDLLLLEAVPAEIPPVAGVLTLAPATPNSHVAILARSFGVPFARVAAEAAQAELKTWASQEVALRVEQDAWGCRVKAVNVQGQLTPEQRAELLALKRPPPLKLPAKQALGQISVSAEGLRPADIRYVGGKAANFGLLRRAIPSQAPAPALAFTFDLWDAFLDQPLPGGRTLRATIAEKLAGFTWPPDIPRLRAALDEIRTLIRQTADFSPTQKAAILQALVQAGLDPERKIRFRSSTNVEDSEQFSGAGLYDSYSGCLADDLDGDNAGPSACDPTEPNERGVLRALLRVYASFYNENAFLERLRHGVDEAAVGMAVLVHHSTPDAIELANGVATVEVDKRFAGWRGLTLHLVTQPGAVSVANPEPNARPEVVRAESWSEGQINLGLERGSGLLPLGATVLAWEEEYRELVRLLDRATRTFEEEFPAKQAFTLDFEYKKIAPEGVLRVKQIREVPRPPVPAPAEPWLLNETNLWTVFQGEYGELFANHRLKASWQFQTATHRLASTNLAASPLRRLAVTMLAGLERTHRAAALAELPGYETRREGTDRVDRWVWDVGSERQTWALHTSLPLDRPPGSAPLVFLSDGRLELTVTYARRRPMLDWPGPGTTLTDTVLLAPRSPVSPRSLRQVRHLTGKGLSVETEFYWPPNPTGPVAGYTAPLQAWIETRITGLTSRPLVLRDEFAQTYRPGHHNFTEDFLFDPHLEPGLDPALLAELRARNIRGLAARAGLGETPEFWLWGLDDTLRAP
jgi:hypothetical protein